nr:hypothetical protein [Tanacetum cinerariifolium]
CVVETTRSRDPSLGFFFVWISFLVSWRSRSNGTVLGDLVVVMVSSHDCGDLRSLELPRFTFLCDVDWIVQLVAAYVFQGSSEQGFGWCVVETTRSMDPSLGFFFVWISFLVSWRSRSDVLGDLVVVMVSSHDCGDLRSLELPKFTFLCDVDWIVQLVAAYVFQ